MTAMLSIEKDRIAVKVINTLGYEAWQVLRDAREKAETTQLPLCVDVEQCKQGDLAGIGSLLLAQEKLTSIKLTGCHGIFFKCFHHFGVCDNCSEEKDHPAGCARRRIEMCA